MKTGFPHEDNDFRHEENDPVWRLLAQSPPSEPDAWFTVRTLARCRHVGLGSSFRGLIFRPFWRWMMGTGVSVALLLMITRVHTENNASSNQQKVQEAFEIMANMGTDADTSSSSSSQDSSL